MLHVLGNPHVGEEPASVQHLAHLGPGAPHAALHHNGRILEKDRSCKCPFHDSLLFPATVSRRFRSFVLRVISRPIAV